MSSPIAITHGPALVGIFLSLVLYGSMITQCFYYWQHYRADPTWLKIYVGFLLFIDTLSTVFAIAWIYGLLINSFGELPKFAVADWLLAADPALVGLTGMFCQLFFAWRIKVLTGKVWMGAGIALLSIASGLCAVGVGIAIGIVIDILAFYKFNAIGSTWLALTATVDVLITITLSWHLRRHRTGFKHTNDILSKIVRLTVQNGALTTIFAVTELGMYLGLPNTGLHIGFSFVLPKLYCNSVLSSLNARRSATNASSGGATSTGPDNEAQMMKSNTAGGTRREVVTGMGSQGGPPEVFVHVATETHEMRDMFKSDPEWDGSSKESFTKQG
ncbi:hypothetical protein PLICRDRAFT_179482 [Plicaturopsis crispa FD-325 SS-3]|uniref:DUF6534 domain-containing protein n=1 Tax=Plicaturopsis crispa FD-325 SS-3 TaxID=944288 RepID=A0A0C9T5T0_PLICR|nr:hypothetical protein PLICRDRAFT_179482 [Plicaturopsis crispa FD-325 SS-3]